MKFPNYLINTLSIVGAFSLIIMACSVDDSNSTNATNSAGRYQISSPSTTIFFVVDTETGVVKKYSSGGCSNCDFVLISTTTTQ
jgi:hypothetical protein